MQKRTKNMTKLLLIIFTGLLLAGTLPSCKASKCDCPEFGGHRLKH